MRPTQYIGFLVLAILLTVGQSVYATRSLETVQTEVSEKKKARIEKRIDRALKKLNKKGLLPASYAAAEEEAVSFDDDRFKYGIVGILGGILLTLILTASLKFLGSILIILGLALVIWAILD